MRRLTYIKRRFIHACVVSVLVIFIGLSPTEALAVTRMYLSNSAPDVTLPSVKGTWTNSANALTRLMAGKSGAAATQASPSSSATNVDYLIGRWQSAPLSADTSFSGSDTIQYVVGAVTSSVTSTTAHFRVHAFVVEADGSTIRGTLLSNSTGAGTAWSTTATGRTDSTLTLAAVNAKAGDRIVVEIGWDRTGGSTAARTTTLNYGNAGTTDLTSGSTSVTTQPGWVEFSPTFSTTTSSAPTVTTSAASSVTNLTATLNGNITNNGAVAETVRGFAWGTNSALSAGDTATTTESGTFIDPAAFTNSSNAYTCNTTYYARAYATNTVGTGYGSIVSFTTTSVCPIVPTRTMRLFEGFRIKLLNGKLKLLQK